MSGSNYLFDTNAVLYFLHQPKKLEDDSSAVFISFVNELELLSYSKLSSNEEKAIIQRYGKKAGKKQPVISARAVTKKSPMVFSSKSVSSIFYGTRISAH